MTTPAISFCTYCMDRLPQAKISIPRALEALDATDECVLVDFSCPEHTAAVFASLYENTPDKRLTIVTVPGMTWWQQTHARNCAALAAQHDLLMFVDIDNLIHKTAIVRARTLQKGSFFALLPGKHFSGFCVIWREDFLKVNGYEEGLSYGYDDTNFYRALECADIHRIDWTDYKPNIIDDPKAALHWEPMEGPINMGSAQWTQNQTITDILRQRHPYKNNMSRNWGKGWNYYR